MEWLSQNWVWVLLFAGFIAMHMFGHGGYGSHKGHGGGRSDPKPAGKDHVQSSSKQSGHQH